MKSRKRWLWLLPVALLALLAATVGVQHLLMQRTDGLYVVTSAQLNVRDSDQFDQSTVTGTLYRGELVRMVSRGEEPFVEVQAAHGLEGYCSQKYLSRPSWLVEGLLKLHSLSQESVSLTNEDVESQIYALAQQYPDTATVEIIGQSVWGENLYALVVGDPDAPHSLMVQGGIHAREYATGVLALAQARDMLEQCAAGASYEGREISDMLSQVNIWFIPQLNPDGALLCQEGLSAAPEDQRDALLAMNNNINDFTRWKANAAGVDLNANFDALWQVQEDQPVPFGNGYAGPEPFSEPETIAVKELVEQHDFMTMLCYHSAGEVIYWYFGQQAEARQRDLTLAEGLAGQNGYRVVRPGKEITSVAGSKDWFVQEYGRPGFTVELFAISAVPVTQSVMQDAVERNLQAAVYLLHEAVERAAQQ